MIQITVSGPEHGGKGYVMAAVTKLLREAGATVSVIGEHNHLAEKFQKLEETPEAYPERLNGVQIQILEMRTAGQ